MFISKKALDKKLEEQKNRIDKSWKITLEVKEERIEQLEKELSEARSLKDILERLTNKSTSLNFIGNGLTVSHCGNDWEFNLPDDVPRYVEDYFGGKVIKQEATKLVIIDEKGNVTYSQTKKQADKGFNYKLLRK